jgi:hypothetical protein
MPIKLGVHGTWQDVPKRHMAIVDMFGLHAEADIQQPQIFEDIWILPSNIFRRAKASYGHRLDRCGIGLLDSERPGVH